MATWLRQSTSVDVPVGPFLDETDGKTQETGLTITQPDIRLKKNNGNWAQKNAAQTLTHEEAGWYEVTLDATDTDTLGILVVAIHESGALPVWREFMVVPSNVWDSYLASDLLQVDVMQFNADATSAANIAKTTRAIGRGTVTTGGSTTSIPTSAFAPAGAVTDQFKGRIITFDADTTTAELRGQATDITGSTSSATPTFTVTALTIGPANTDTFSVT